jgi:hypothetical protein
MLALFPAGHHCIVSLGSLSVISEFGHSAYHIGVGEIHYLHEPCKGGDILAVHVGMVWTLCVYPYNGSGGPYHLSYIQTKG